jgi:hypothetical protein
MIRPLTRAENARVQATIQRITALEDAGGNIEKYILANSPTANNTPVKIPGRNRDAVGLVFDGASFKDYFGRGATSNNATIFYLRMLCIYVNKRVGRGDSGSNRRKVPFVALGRALWQMNTMGVVRKLDVELASRRLTEDGLSHVSCKDSFPVLLHSSNALFEMTY